VLSARSAAKSSQGRSRIDRAALVRRHNPVVTRFDPGSALSLGNGEFAFTADITGLQTFAAECAGSFPVCTTAHWAWHSFPMPAGLKREDLKLKEYDAFGRKVGYATDARGQEVLFNHLRQNPHRLHLGQVGLELRKEDGALAAPGDLRAGFQTLDLWSGLLDSQFELGGQPVRVQTCVHPEIDAVAVRIESPLLPSGRLKVIFAFPYGSPEAAMADWARPERHSTGVIRQGDRQANLERRLDDTTYVAVVEWADEARFAPAGAHRFTLEGGGPVLEFACGFAPGALPRKLPGFRETARASAVHWRKFWSEGGAIDLSASTDTRAQVLENRTVLSLYQTAIHCAGSLPSAETGLLCNSWYGKFHLEMHWWHSVHFAAWNRFHLFERSLGIYRRLLPGARELARSQGYRGARWPKMIGPDGYDSPSPVGPLLIWQQPHPIYYAELCYRERPTRRTLEHWNDIVIETANFMASYAAWDEGTRRFVLGPPMKTVSENTDSLTALNPTFELSYWRFGLRVAIEWCRRLGVLPCTEWQSVLTQLAELPVESGLYLMQEGMGDTYTKWNWEHPALAGAYGMLPGDGVDPAIMRASVKKLTEVWQWDRTWGWDFGLTAMAAARVGEPELAVQALLVDTPKNRFWPNGHNYQRPGLSAYLPGNGSLLCAMAMMSAGWMGGPEVSAPGFPDDGKWRVVHEGLRRWV